MTGVPEVLHLLPGLDIINDKMAEKQGVLNWSFPGPCGTSWAVDNSVDNVDKMEFGVLVGQEPNNSVYLAP